MVLLLLFTVWQMTDSDHFKARDKDLAGRQQDLEPELSAEISEVVFLCMVCDFLIILK